MARKKDLENFEEIRPPLSDHSSASADRQSIQRRRTRCAHARAGEMFYRDFLKGMKRAGTFKPF